MHEMGSEIPIRRSRAELVDLSLHGTDRQLFIAILDLLEIQMAAIDDLTAAVNSLSDQVTGLESDESAAASELQALANGFVTLQGQVSQLLASGSGSATDAQLEAVAQTASDLASKVGNVASALSASTQAAQGEVPNPTPDPLPSPTPSPSPTPTPAPDPNPSPAPTPGPNPEPPVPAQTQATRPLYTTSADPSSVNSADWPTSDLQSTDTPPLLLYYFSGDTQNGDGSWNVTGDGLDGQWSLYKGSSQPVAPSA